MAQEHIFLTIIINHTLNEQRGVSVIRCVNSHVVSDGTRGDTITGEGRRKQQDVFFYYYYYHYCLLL